jgi:hypothetical protein
MKNINLKALLLSIFITLAISGILYFMFTKPPFLIYFLSAVVFGLTIRLVYYLLTNKKQKL